MDGLDVFELFRLALGLAPPWQVSSVEFDQDIGTAQLGLDFARGSRFACPWQGCTESACPLHDTDNKTWRHLDFSVRSRSGGRPGRACASTARRGADRRRSSP